jgi:hypothetical protein
MGVGVAGELEAWIGGDPAGEVGIALDPFSGQEERCGCVAALQLVYHTDVGVGPHLSGVQLPEHRVSHV